MNARIRSELQLAQVEFEKAYPGEKILVCEFGKGILSRENAAQFEDYVTSQESPVILSDKRIKANQWDIMLTDIEKALLIKNTFVTGALFGKKATLILQVKNKEMQYQFDLKDDTKWQVQNALKVHYLQPEKGNYSLLIIIAIVIIGLIVILTI
jgi:hypothetical protein